MSTYFCKLQWRQIIRVLSFGFSKSHERLLPPLTFTVRSAPCANNILTTSTLPLSHAKCNAVYPYNTAQFSKGFLQENEDHARIRQAC